MTEGERAERVWLESEIKLAATLTDAERIRIFKDLLRTAEAIQRTKSPEQLEREEEVRRLLEYEPAKARYAELVTRLA